MGGSEVAASLALAGQPVERAQLRAVALVQPPHAVALVMDVVGDVLQVLQVGPARVAARREGIRSQPHCPTVPTMGCSTPNPIPCSPDQQVPQEGELAVCRVLHCKARQRGSGWRDPRMRIPQALGTTRALAQHHAAPLGRGAPTGAAPHTPSRPSPCLRMQRAPLTLNDAPLGLAAQHPLAIDLVLLVCSHHSEGDILLPVQSRLLCSALLWSPGLGIPSPSIPALTRILLFSTLSSGSWSKSSCGYTLIAWVFRSSWICGIQGLKWG